MLLEGLEEFHALQGPDELAPQQHCDQMGSQQQGCSAWHFKGWLFFIEEEKQRTEGGMQSVIDTPLWGGGV